MVAIVIAANGYEKNKGSLKDRQFESRKKPSI
jgi:hypothetical protein